MPLLSEVLDSKDSETLLSEILPKPKDSDVLLSEVLPVPAKSANPYDSLSKAETIGAPTGFSFKDMLPRISNDTSFQSGDPIGLSIPNISKGEAPIQHLVGDVASNLFSPFTMGVEATRRQIAGEQPPSLLGQYRNAVAGFPSDTPERSNLRMIAENALLLGLPSKMGEAGSFTEREGGKALAGDISSYVDSKMPALIDTYRSKINAEVESRLPQAIEQAKFNLFGEDATKDLSKDQIASIRQSLFRESANDLKIEASRYVAGKVDPQRTRFYQEQGVSPERAREMLSKGTTLFGGIPSFSVGDLVNAAGELGHILKIDPETKAATILLNAGRTISMRLEDLNQPAAAPNTQAQTQINQATGVSSKREPITVNEPSALKAQIQKEISVRNQAVKFGKSEQIKASNVKIKALKDQLSQSVSKSAALKQSLVKEQSGSIAGAKSVIQGQMAVEKGGAKFRESQLKQEIDSRVPEGAALKRSLSRQQTASIEGARAGVENLQTMKQNVVNLIKENLPSTEHGKFISSVQTAKTPKDVARIGGRIAVAVKDYAQKDLVNSIKDSVQKALESSSIAQDYKDKISQAISRFQMKGISQGRLENLKSTQAWLREQQTQGYDVEIPKRVIDNLGILTRKPLSELSMGELTNLQQNLDLLKRLGETKLSARQAIYEAKKKMILGQLVAGTKPIEKVFRLQHVAGTPVTTMEKWKTAFGKAFNIAQGVDLYIGGMDVHFDLLDDVQDYRGPNTRWFKKEPDTLFGNYLSEFQPVSDSIQKLTDSLRLEDANFERIGIHAYREQPNGIDYLLDRGLTQEQIDAVKLTKPEMKMYQAMRDAIEAPYDRVRDTLLRVDNLPMGKIPNYFPVQTDFQVEEENVESRLQKSMSGFRTKTTEQGFTKERVGGKQQVQLNAMTIFLKHMDDVYYYLNLREHIKMMFEVANTPEYASAAGQIGQKITLDYLDLMARKGGVAGQQKIAWLDTLRKNTSFALIGLNAATAVAHTALIFQGSAFLGPSLLHRGAPLLATDPRYRDFLEKNFPEWRYRGGSYPEMGKGEMSSWEPMEKIQELSMAPLRIITHEIAGATALEAYLQDLEKRGIPFDFDKADPEAVSRATLIMRRTQASPYFKDMSLAQTRGSIGGKGNKSVAKTLLIFHNLLLDKWSLYRHDMIRAGFGKKDLKKAFNIPFWLFVSAVVWAGWKVGAQRLKGAITGHTPKKPQTIAGQTLVTLLDSVPFVSEVVNSAIYGELPFPSIMEPFRVIVGTGEMVTGKTPGAPFLKPSDNNRLKGAVDAAEGFGSILGIPGIGQVGQYARSALQGPPKQTQKEIRAKMLQLDSDSPEWGKLNDELFKVKEENRKNRQKSRKILSEEEIDRILNEQSAQ